MCIEEQQICHGNFNCDLSGFVITREIQYIGALPDGFVQCDCCGKGCKEIKCPFLHAKNTSFEAVCHDFKKNQIIQGVPSLVKKRVFSIVLPNSVSTFCNKEGMVWFGNIQTFCTDVQNETFYYMFNLLIFLVECT